jgi:hypothetical protein
LVQSKIIVIQRWFGELGSEFHSARRFILSSIDRFQSALRLARCRCRPGVDEPHAALAPVFISRQASIATGLLLCFSNRRAAIQRKIASGKWVIATGPL